MAAKRQMAVAVASAAHKQAARNHSLRQSKMVSAIGVAQKGAQTVRIHSLWVESIATTETQAREDQASKHSVPQCRGHRAAAIRSPALGLDSIHELPSLGWART